MDIFGSGDASADVAQHWLEKYRASDAEALADLINCVLQCAGCDQEVTVDDIRDPENIPSRLVDLQSIYQEVWRSVSSAKSELLNTDTTSAKYYRVSSNLKSQEHQVLP